MTNEEMQKKIDETMSQVGKLFLAKLQDQFQNVQDCMVSEINRTFTSVSKSFGEAIKGLNDEINTLKGELNERSCDPGVLQQEDEAIKKDSQDVSSEAK